MIQTERLIFRRYTAEDLDFLTSMTSDHEMMKYIGPGVTWSASETMDRLDRFMRWYQLDEGIGLMVAIRKDDGMPVGHAGLVPQLVEEQSELEVGYWIKQEFWGQGFAKECAIGWRVHGLETLGKHRLISLIQSGNKPSIQVAIANGMTYEREVTFHEQQVGLYAIEKKCQLSDE